MPLWHRQGSWYLCLSQATGHLSPVLGVGCICPVLWIRATAASQLPRHLDLCCLPDTDVYYVCVKYLPLEV